MERPEARPLVKVQKVFFVQDKFNAPRWNLNLWLFNLHFLYSRCSSHYLAWKILGVHQENMPIFPPSWPWMPVIRGINVELSFHISKVADKIFLVTTPFFGKKGLYQLYGAIAVAIIVLLYLTAGNFGLSKSGWRFLWRTRKQAPRSRGTETYMSPARHRWRYTDRLSLVGSIER